VPELPEVEAARRAAERVGRNRRIVGVWVGDDPIVFERVPAARFRRALVGRRVRGVKRHGKHLWLELDQRPWPCLHFGMTGGFHVPGRGTVRLVAHGKKGPGVAWPPRFVKLILKFDDGGELAYADARRLGRVRLRDNPAAEPPISRLGFDAWRGLPPFAEFAEQVRKRSLPMKALLLDQSFAAGVGNWIADEVLYQARIDPRRRAGTLKDDEIRRLRAAIRHVIEVSVRARNDSDHYPRTWLFHDRWGKNPKAYTARGEKIRHDTIGGRTTAWVPSVQR
jgi:formamidopyrimidine-DNA glycosylase